jgi:hypothetical protein
LFGGGRETRPFATGNRQKGNIMSRKYPKKVRKEFKRKLKAFMPREDGLKPFTIIRDWDADWWDKAGDGIRFTDEPQMFQVWAASGSDASDEVERVAVEQWGESAFNFSKPVAVLQGHVPFAQD